MDITFQNGTLLLLIAAVVAMISRRLRLPYSVGLVLAGIVLSMAPFAPHVTLTKDLIFTALLPPLLFEGAYYLHWDQLRRDFCPIAVLATFGVAISACVTAAAMHYLAHWQWLSATVFGVLIAATDPVSVIATFKEAKAKGRLLVLIEAESLLNDGTAAVAFAVVIAVAAGQAPTSLQVAFMLLKMIGGGVLCGGAIAWGALLLAGRTNDHLVEITLTTIAAYGSFLLADHFGLSGVLATITAGLVMANFTRFSTISERGTEAVQAFWEYAAFIANSLIFLLIGMRGAGQPFGAVGVAVLVALAAVTVGRAAAVYPLSLLFLRSKLRISTKHQHALVWGGLRGALALALALGLPVEIARKEQIITVSFAVVAFSVFVQGLTMAPLLRTLGELPAPTSIKGNSHNHPPVAHL